MNTIKQTLQLDTVSILLKVIENKPNLEQIMDYLSGFTGKKVHPLKKEHRMALVIGHPEKQPFWEMQIATTAGYCHLEYHPLTRIWRVKSQAGKLKSWVSSIGQTIMFASERICCLTGDDAKRSRT